MRNRFDKQLELLNRKMIEMGAACEEVIQLAIDSLMKNEDCTKEAAERERDIDRMERDIESLCMKLLLQQQPVAKDLRTISSALKMISDMERIGDQVLDIAEIASQIGGYDIKHFVLIDDMAQAVIKMVTLSVDSFVRKDLKLAAKVIASDDEADLLFDKIKRTVINNLNNNHSDKDNSEFYIDILMIAKYLERIGDHATNIAEWVEFSVTGAHTQEG